MQNTHNDQSFFCMVDQIKYQIILDRNFAFSLSLKNEIG